MRSLALFILSHFHHIHFEIFYSVISVFWGIATEKSSTFCELKCKAIQSPSITVWLSALFVCSERNSGDVLRRSFQFWKPYLEDWNSNLCRSGRNQFVETNIHTFPPSKCQVKRSIVEDLSEPLQNDILTRVGKFSHTTLYTPVVHWHNKPRP